MSERDRLAAAAAVAVLLASTALMPVFDSGLWVVRTVVAVAVVVGTGVLARRARLPRALHPLAALAALVAYATLVFAGATLHHLVLPGADTVTAVRGLLRTAGEDLQAYGPPAPVTPGLALLVVLGVGAVAVVVETVTVLWRSAAAAGLPLLSLFAVPSAVMPGGLGWLPFALGAAGWLGLLIVEGAEVRDRWGTALQTRRSPSAGLGRAGRRIGGTALGVAVLVPALVPGLDGRLLDGGEGGGGGSGTSRSVNTYNPITRLRGELTLPVPVDVLRYTTDDPSPDYLRMTTLGVYDGNGWRQQVLNGNVRDNGVDGPLPAPVGRAPGAPAQLVRATIDVLSLDAFWLPAPATPVQVDVEGPWMWDPGSESVFATRSDTTDVDPYTVTAARLVPEPDDLDAATSVVPQEVLPYAGPVDATPVVRSITESVTAGAETDYDKAVALQAFFRSPGSGFRYEEQTESGGSPDALQAFLEARVGFCEQYASAMAAMLRLAGVPSRVAVGFTPGQQQADGSYVVTTDEAHAWPEAWFEGFGWVRFEPTPSQNGIRPPSYGNPPALPDQGPTVAPGASATPGPSSSAGESAADRRLADEERRNQVVTPLADGPSDDGGPPVRGLAVGGGVALLLALPALVHALRRRRRWREPGPTAAWAQLRDDTTDAGHPLQDAESPRQATARLASSRRLGAPEREALDRVTHAVERDRYARPGAAQPSAGLRDDVALVRRTLLGGVPRGRQVRARVLPPSTVAWAVTGVRGAWERVLGRVDELGPAVRRRLVRRA